MDPKILAAVFASIAAIAVGTGGTGSVDNFQNIQPQDIIDSLSDTSKFFPKNIEEKPEPENEVKITMEANSDNAGIQLQNSDITVQDFTKLESESKIISSDEPLTFSGFTGNIEIYRDNETVISGNSEGFASSGVNFTQKLNLDFRTGSESIVAEKVEKTGISLEEADVEVISQEEDTTIEKGNSPVDINSFSGKMSIYPDNMTVILNGKVDKVEAGSTVYN